MGAQRAITPEASVHTEMLWVLLELAWIVMVEYEAVDFLTLTKVTLKS